MKSKIRHCILGLVMTCGAVADEARLDAVLQAQESGARARYADRHPAETLSFFGIKPGMIVVEALPGRGWYSKILGPYLGSDGQLIGADYPLDMYPKFNLFNEEFLEKKKTWVADWTSDASRWAGDSGATVGAFVFGSMPDELAGTADAVLLVRALHNLKRFEHDGGYLTTALHDVHRVLKPGGLLGVVQHMAPDDKPDEWADGNRGYLKKSFVIERLTTIGFELVAESDVNLNPNDQPGDDDIVWRLSPSFATSSDDPIAKAAFRDIGESNRMTLLFRKQ